MGDAPNALAAWVEHVVIDYLAYCVRVAVEQGNVGARLIRQLSGASVDPVSAYRRFLVLDDMSCAAIVNNFLSVRGKKP